jgi:hypothetical protein
LRRVAGHDDDRQDLGVDKIIEGRGRSDRLDIAFRSEKCDEDIFVDCLVIVEPMGHRRPRLVTGHATG